MSTFSVGLLRDLPPKRVMRAHVAGQDLVVWRATNGDISAWDNRCPHRGMALSHGFVRGNSLACLYHGWHYNSAGTCSLIPAHPDLEPPSTIETKKFSVEEQDGVIWVNTDGPVKPPPLPFASRPIRSFFVETAASVFQTSCVNVPFESEVPRATDEGVYQIGSLQVVAFENPLTENRTQVTVLANATASDAECAALSRWCEAVGRQALHAAEVTA